MTYIGFRQGGPPTGLTKLRVEKQITRNQLAKLGQVDAKFITHIETGHSTLKRAPTADSPQLPRLAPLYGISIEELKALIPTNGNGNGNGNGDHANGNGNGHPAPEPKKKVTPAVKRTATAKVGKNTGPRRRGGLEPTGLGKIRYDLGLTVKQLAKKAGVDAGLVRKLEKGGIIALNHPRIPQIAEAYGVSLKKIKAQCADREMGSRWLSQAGKAKIRKSKSGKAVVLARLAGVVPAKRGPGSKAVVRAGGKRAYNMLKRLKIPTRQFVRGMATSINMYAMKGEAYVDLGPLPIALAHDFLTDYMQAKGIKVPMLVDPDFARQFD